jgi:hypothetical protein
MTWLFTGRWAEYCASLGDLKARVGHDRARAAMIGQHATAAADRAIADALNERIEASEKDGGDRPDDDGLGGVLISTG